MATDLFPGFTRQTIHIPDGPSLFARVSGDDKTKPPLLLLHGFPQTHVEYHKIAPRLRPHFTLVLLDLRGYGASSCVASSNGSGYSKRLMARDCVAAMAQLGFGRFGVLGHDRGARVAYRLAFDAPASVERVVVVDVVPTATMFARFGAASAALKAYHWLFLAQPEPLPERMIEGADGGRLFLERCLATWTAGQDLKTFDVAAVEAYREAYCKAERIHATCEDYRAGAYLDRVYDEEELEKGRKIEVPLMAVWGQTELVADPVSSKAKGQTPLDVWQKYAKDVVGKGLKCGHFIPEEDPDGLVDAILPFFGIRS